MKINSQDLKREAFAFAMMMKATAASLERYCECISVEDADTYEDIINEYWKAYDG